MTSPFNKSSDPIAAIQREIAEIRRIAEEGARRPFHIPIVSEDPPESDPTNLWLFPDGRLRARHRNVTDTAWVYREWVTTSPGSSTSATAPAPPTATATTHQGVWNAIWSQSYRSTGAQRTDAGATMLYYGSSGDSFNGRNQSLIGFDYAAIATALTGSTINSVALRLTNVHAWYDSGVNIYFGIHNFTSKPATWAGGGIPRQRIVSHHFGKPQYREVPMPLEFAQAIRDGWGKGIAIEAPSTSREFYGYAAGFGSSYTVPQLVITYAK